MFFNLQDFSLSGLGLGLALKENYHMHPLLTRMLIPQHLLIDLICRGRVRQGYRFYAQVCSKDHRRDFHFSEKKNIKIGNSKSRMLIECLQRTFYSR